MLNHDVSWTASSFDPKRTSIVKKPYIENPRSIQWKITSGNYLNHANIQESSELHLFVALFCWKRRLTSLGWKGPVHWYENDNVEDGAQIEPGTDAWDCVLAFSTNNCTRSSCHFNSENFDVFYTMKVLKV